MNSKAAGMPGPGRAVLGAMLLLVAGAGAAEAAGKLQVLSCPSAFAREVRWLLEIELPGPERGKATSLVVVRCTGQLVTVSALDASERHHAQRTLDLESVAVPARARLVALSAAELVAALESQRTKPARPPVRRWALTGSTNLGMVGPRRSFAYGGAVALDHLTFRHVGWRAELALQHASENVSLGRAEAWLASAVAAVTVSWSGRWGRVIGGVGGRLGVCHLAGAADDPTVEEGTVTGMWGGPHALVGWRLPLDRVLLSLGVELTYISLPVSGRVSGDGPYEIDELLLLGSAGLGFSL
jgi:hypothetical protein